MNQPELGKTEEEIEVTSTSAGLSESGTEVAPNATEPTTAEEDVSATLDVPAASADSDDADSANAPAEAHGLKRGTLVKATITHTSPTEVLLTLENGVEALIPRREIETMSQKLLDDLKDVGREITVYVVNPRNHQGKTVVSYNYALEEQDWGEAENYRQSKVAFDGKIGGYNKGGLIVRFGRLRGFVPQSQIAEERLREMTGETPEERYGRMVNHNITVKVMEVDRSRNRLILSERAAMREVRQRRKESLIHELQENEIREGVVVSLENFGAFVDVGGAEGLVHLTEITWRHITHPRQALNKGQHVRVKVISVDPDHNRIGLSIKQLLPDPWDEIALEYGSGALVKGVITKLTKFGAFARIDGAGNEPIEGLIHISELSDERVEHPKEVVNKGDILTLRVVKVDVKERRLGLSLKKVHSAEYLDEDMDRAFRDADRDPIPFSEPTAEVVAEYEDAPAAVEVTATDDTPAE